VDDELEMEPHAASTGTLRAGGGSSGWSDPPG
jgi:hypothetical protein